MFAPLTISKLATAPAAVESWCLQGTAAYRLLSGVELRLDSATPKHESPVSIRNFAGANQEMGT
jgi:hypothetical protein